MNPFLLVYLFVSLVISATAWISAGWSPGLGALTTSAVSLIAGDGFQASLRKYDNRQTIGGFVIAGATIAAVMYFVGPVYSVHLFGYTLSGEEWGWVGAGIGFMFADKRFGWRAKEPQHRGT